MASKTLATKLDLSSVLFEILASMWTRDNSSKARCTLAHKIQPLPFPPLGFPQAAPTHNQRGEVQVGGMQGARKQTRGHHDPSVVLKVDSICLMRETCAVVQLCRYLALPAKTIRVPPSKILHSSQVLLISTTSCSPRPVHH